MTSAVTWTCPHCGHPQTATHANQESDYWKIQIGETAIGSLALHSHAKRCLNSECNKPLIEVSLWSSMPSETEGGTPKHGRFKSWRLIPESSAKPQPDYIPSPIVQDYTESCKIRDLSPKASAALSRRCLQGMIRDFCGISKNTLKAEIEALDALVKEGKEPRGVSQDSVQAIDHVRGIGNIGAHMEKDINLIVDIDPREAQVLIELIETLFEEWYVARHLRTQRFERLANIAASKETARKPGPSS